MSATDLNEYNTDIGRLKENNGFFMKAAGIFKFFDKDVTGTDMKLRVALNHTIIGPSAGVFSVVQLPAETRKIFLNANDALSNASLLMPAGIVNQELEIMMLGVASAASVIISTGSGGLIEFSSISIRQSNDNGYVRFICLATDLWGIAHTTGAITRKAD